MLSPTALASTAASRASSSSRPTSTSGWSGWASQASLEPKPPRRAVMQISGRDVSLVELELGAHVDHERAVALGLLHLARRERVGLHRVLHQRAAVERDDVLEVRRLRTEPVRRAAHEVVLVLHLEHRLGGALEADRRGDLEVHPGPAAHRAAEVTRPHLAGVRKRHQLVGQRTEDPARALGLVHREVGPCDVAHEQAVAGEDGPGLAAPVRGDQRERGVLRPVAGGVDRADGDVAEPELPAVVEGLVLVVGRRLAVHVDRGPGGRCEAPVARDVVGVVVRLEDVLDVDTEEAGEAQVLVDVELGIDDRGDAGVLVADQIAGAAQVVMDQLAEDHPPTLRRRRATSATRRALPARPRARARARGRARARAPAPLPRSRGRGAAGAAGVT